MTSKQLITLMFSAAIALAQTDQARIVGTITDTNGAVVPSASVIVKSEKTGTERTVTANEQGYYIVTNLLPGLYTVTAKSQGLGPTEFSGISLGIGQERAVNVSIQPAALQQEVTVSGGEMVVIDVSSARIGANVSEREVAQLPLNGRQLSQLYLLAPGAVNSGSGNFDNIRFSGRANQQNIVRYDGIEGTSIIDASPGNLNGETSSSFRLQSSLENVQEFRVDSNNYPAEYGTGTGGQISVVTKSGSNAFHGALFEYLRNDKLDARNFFDGTLKSPLRLNQFGGSVGGPIQKEKLFFFASYEGLRQRAGVNFRETVPSAAARARAVPSIRPLLAAFPLGSSATANPDFDLAALNASNQVTENAGGIRLDYRFSPKYSLYARYFRDEGESFAPQGVTGNALRVRAVPQNAIVNLQQILSPSLINETKVGLNHNKTRPNGLAPSIPGVDLTAITVSIAGQVALGGIQGQTASASVATPGGLFRSNSASNGRGQPYTNYSVSFIDNLSWVKGSHSAKFGLELRPIRLYTDRLGGTTYTFSNVNDFLNNVPLQIQFLGDVSAASPFNGGQTGVRLAKQMYYIGYAQDEWKLRPNLTMNYGLRYEYYTVLHEDRNLDVVFNTVTGQIMPSDTPFYHSSKKNFAPRLAFTWSPTKMEGKTVFRIGAGYYYGPGQTEDQIQPIESDRVSRTLPSGAVFPIDPAQIIATYDINSSTLGYQPRAYAPGYRIPERILSYTASIQQQIPAGALLTVAYAGSQGRNLFLRSITNKIIGVTQNAATGAGSAVREFGGRFAEIDYKTSGGTDHYDSLQTMLNRRFSRGLSLASQWTWAHSIGNTSGSNEARTAANNFSFAADRGNNNFDVRHSFNVSALYEFPSRGNHLTNAILGGWQLGGIVNARTGVPIEVLVTRNDIVYRDTRNGAIVNNPVLVNGQVVTTAIINTPGGGASRSVRRPDVVSGVNPYLHNGTQFLNPAAFAIPQPGAFGNLGRNALHGPNLSQLDITLDKKFRVTEKSNIEFRAEFYNILNHANFALPPATLANNLGTATNQVQPGQPFSLSAAGGNFGIFNSTVERQVGLGTNRQIQFALRYQF